MTATITVSCPEGIVLAADKRITYLGPDGQPPFFVDDIEKVFHFTKASVGASYWGLAEIGPVRMLDFLSEFESSSLADNDDVNSVAAKLVSRLRDVTPKITRRMGIHLAGYCRREETYPQLRHVFHEHWHENGEFTDEDSNREYYQQDGSRLEYRSYEPFIARFNGDNSIANALFSSIPRLTGRDIILDLLGLAECIRLAELIVRTSGELFNFYFTRDQSRIIPGVRGLSVATVTKEEGFQWVR
jgi:hypothetical protein